MILELESKLEIRVRNEKEKRGEESPERGFVKWNFYEMRVVGLWEW